MLFNTEFTLEVVGSSAGEGHYYTKFVVTTEADRAAPQSSTGSPAMKRAVRLRERMGASGASDPPAT
eukprot:2722565-Rhodomonas_salina.1